MAIIRLDKYALRGTYTVRQQLHYDFFRPTMLLRRPEDGERTEEVITENDPEINIPAKNADFLDREPYVIRYDIRRKLGDASLTRELKDGWGNFVTEYKDVLTVGSEIEISWHPVEYLLLMKIVAPPPPPPPPLLNVVVPRKPRTRRKRPEDSAAECLLSLKAAGAGAGTGAGAGAGAGAVDDAGAVEQEAVDCVCATSPGGYLGLVNSSELTKNRFIGFVFNTKLVPHFNDTNDNHVGLDVNSLQLIKTAYLLSKGIDLNSGDLINVWIDYKNERKLVKIYMGYSNTKPKNPVLEVEIDLSEYLKEFVHLGFSGTSEGSTEVHLIESFGLQTFGFLPARPHYRTHNVSDSTVTITPAPRLKSSSKNPRDFSYRELKFATKGFHSSRILGSGAFGTVYKAYFLSSGVIAAVKRSKHNHENKAEFLAELSIIACLRHKNLVQLQGWCAEKGELLLVYDYMLNGSLDKVLYPETKIDNNLLPWPQRYNVVVGLASVLTYLHQECEQQAIHRDIKTSNVLLDGSFNPKLGDFGLARLMDHDKSPVSTLTAGTMGYLAPEYLQYGKATEKTDVFSYGVVVLEVACGRQPIERVIGDQNVVNLVDWVWGLHSQGRLLEAADPRLKREFDEAQMKKLLLVGLSCTNPDCLERPNMRRVLQILNNEAGPVLVPKSKPTLIFSSSLPLSIEDIVSDYEV